MKEKYDIIYLTDRELGIPSNKKGGRPCIIIDIDIEGDMNYVIPLTYRPKSQNEDDSRHFLPSIGSFVNVDNKPINVTYLQIKYGDLAEDLELSYEDIEFIKLYF